MQKLSYEVGVIRMLRIEEPKDCRAEVLIGDLKKRRMECKPIR